MTWGWIYSTQYGWTPSGTPPSSPDPVIVNDIIQTQHYDATFGGYPVIVVGGKFSPTAFGVNTDWNGMWMCVDPDSGFTFPITLYDTHSATDPESNEIFSGVCSTPNGYYVSGKCENLYGTDLFNNWVTKIAHQSASGWPTINWSNIYPSVISGSDYSLLADIKYRNATDELYAIGKDFDTDHQRLTLVKLDAAGNILTGRYYDRGSIDVLEPVDIDLNTNGTANGVGLYSYTSDAFSMNILKGYFNGVYDCSSSSYAPSDAPITLTSYGGNLFGEEFENGEIVVDEVYNLDYTDDCYAETVVGGNNSFVGIRKLNTNQIFESRLYPNPLENNSILHLQIAAATSGSLEITVFDLMGKVVFIKTVETKSGNNIVDIAYSELKLNAGIYLFKAKSVEQTISYRMILK